MVKLAKYKFIILFELKTRKFLKRTCCLGRGIYRSQRNFFLFQGYGIEYERPIGSSVGLSSFAVINDNLVILGAEDHFVLDFRSYARGIYNQVNQESNSPHCNLSSHFFRHQRRCLQPSLAALRRLQHPHRQRASGC